MTEIQCFVGLEWLRIIAAFGIVGCHLALPEMTASAYILQRFTDFNVGIFAVIAGFFATHTIKPADRWATALHARSRRLVLPYLFWTGLYVITDIGFDILTGKSLSFKPMSLAWWSETLFLGSGAAHLWFLIALFYVQAATFPVLRLSARHKTTYLSLIWILCGFSIVWICPSVGGWLGKYGLRLAGFFCIGVALHHEQERLMRIPTLFYATLLCLGLFIQGIGWRFGYVGESIVILPAFLTCLSWKPADATICRIGKVLGGLSFGVYLSHLLFTIAIRQAIAILDITPQTACIYLADWIIAFTLALATASILRWISSQMRWPKWIVP